MITIERLEEIMDETSWEKYEGDGIFLGLSILSKYTNKRIIGGAEHDIIYGPEIEEIIDAGITEEEVKKLSVYGWGVDSEFDCFYHFV